MLLHGQYGHDISTVRGLFSRGNGNLRKKKVTSIPGSSRLSSSLNEYDVPIIVKRRITIAKLCESLLVTYCNLV